jgi:hypothetical protein
LLATASRNRLAGVEQVGGGFSRGGDAGTARGAEARGIRERLAAGVTVANLCNLTVVRVPW